MKGSLWFLKILGLSSIFSTSSIPSRISSEELNLPLITTLSMAYDCKMSSAHHGKLSESIASGRFVYFLIFAIFFRYISSVIIISSILWKLLIKSIPERLWMSKYESAMTLNGSLKTLIASRMAKLFIKIPSIPAVFRNFNNFFISGRFSSVMSCLKFI